MKSDWEITIGLETHVQLLTATKMFSTSSNAFGKESNRNTNEVDMALPGSLPVANVAAIKCAIKFGLAVNAKISSNSMFARKHYFYPDLPKGYQISQFHIPILRGGSISFFENGNKKIVNLAESHLEEDAGKSIHHGFSSGIDLNRAGTPLLEIVTEPEMHSAQEAVMYAKALRELVVWLGISDGNMQEGSFRCDANVSVKLKNEKKLGTRTEIKNINSFKFLEKAITFEANRQIDLIERNKSVTQETRLYDSEKNETRSMRSKENANDYRYMPDPDLPTIYIDQNSDVFIEAMKEIPELPEEKRNRFKNEYNLTNNDILQLLGSLQMAEYFESVAKNIPKDQAKVAANWINGELTAFINKKNKDVLQIPIRGEILAELINKVLSGSLSNKNAKLIFEIICDSGQENIDEIIKNNNFEQITDDNFIVEITNKVISENPIIVQDCKSGKEKAFNVLIGKAMQLSKGKANPSRIKNILEEKIKA